MKRLYDLVQVKDERVKVAFYHALRDTLVADNLDQATRIAYPKVIDSPIFHIFFYLIYLSEFRSKLNPSIKLELGNNIKISQ